MENTGATQINNHLPGAESIGQTSFPGTGQGEDSSPAGGQWPPLYSRSGLQACGGDDSSPAGGQWPPLHSQSGGESFPEQVIGELAAIGLTRATDVLTISEDGLQIKQPEQMTGSSAAAISSVEKTSGGWKVKFYDKLKALELLGEHFGLFGSNAPGPVREENNLLEAILSSTEEAMDTSDLQELQ